MVSILKINVAGVISMNVPTTNKIMLIINRMTYLLLEIDNNPFETIVGMFVKAITQDIILETPIKKIMIPVISALALKISGKSFHFIDLYP